MAAFGSKRGFTLIMVLASIALLGVFAVMMSQMLVSNRRAQTGIQNSIDFDILKSTIHMIANQPGLCTSALYNAANTAPAQVKTTAPLPAAADQLGTIRIGPSIVAQVGQALGGGLYVSRLELRVSATTPSTTTTHVAQIIVEAERRTGALGSTTISNEATAPFVTLVTDYDSTTNSGAGNIVSCTASTRQFAETMEEILDSVAAYEQTVCISASNDVEYTVTAACPADRRLFTCTGGPGAQQDGDESFWIIPNYATNVCTLVFRNSDCNAARDWTRQRVTALCYPI